MDAIDIVIGYFRDGNLIRRSREENGKLFIDHKTWTMAFNGSLVRASKNQMRLTTALIVRQGHVVPVEELLDFMYGDQPEVRYENIGAAIHQIAPILATLGFRVENSYGQGYTARACISRKIRRVA